ncbi:MAG: hypothetical protein WA941_10720 [Nitrososphaeraceae archaeon]
MSKEQYNFGENRFASLELDAGRTLKTFSMLGKKALKGFELLGILESIG